MSAWGQRARTSKAKDQEVPLYAIGNMIVTAALLVTAAEKSIVTT